MAVVSLEALTANLLAKSLTERLEELIIAHDNDGDESKLISSARYGKSAIRIAASECFEVGNYGARFRIRISKLSKLTKTLFWFSSECSVLDNLHPGLLNRVIAEIADINHFCGLLSSFIFAGSIPKLHSGTQIAYFFASNWSRLLGDIAPHWTAGLEEVDLSSVYVDDLFLQGLASSAATQTLRKLKLNRFEFTDRSAECWGKLESLKELEMDFEHPCETSYVSHIAKFGRSIECLTFPGGSPYMDQNMTFDIVLAPEAFPLLAELNLRLSEDEESGVSVASLFERLFTALQARKSNHLIRCLNVVPLEGTISHEKVLQILRLCPNLERLPVVSDDPNCLELIAQVAPKLKIIHDGSSAYIFVDVQRVETIGSWFPELENVRLCFKEPFKPDDVINLQQFTCAKHIGIECVDLAHVEWPKSASVKTLVVCVLSEAFPMDPGKLNKFIYGICVAECFESLTDLTIELSGNEISLEQQIQLLDALRNLESIRISGMESNKRSHEATPVSHPGLQHQPFLNSHKLVPARLPRLCLWTQKDEGIVLAQHLIPKNLPSMRRLDIGWRFAEGDQEGGEEGAEEMFQVLNRD
jgi:hypothetical protein